jgi:hypothetical protein
MLVVVASRYDKAAEALVGSWAGQGASLLTCEDLSVVGWRHHLTSSKDSTAVVGGQVVGVEQIVGVLTRIPCVFEQELLQIVPADRSYVAAEMNAFLISWLSRLKCPVLNRPTPTYLLGPNWRPQQWLYAAAQLGIPVHPMRRYIALSGDVCPKPPEMPPVTVTVVGDRIFGSVDQALATQARRLADAAKVDLLAVHFSGSESGADFLGADLWPDISSPNVADAILEYLSGGGGKC